MAEPKKVEWWYDGACQEIEAISDALYGSAPLIADIIARHAPKPEAQPIRRGDVVQVDPALWGGRVRPRLWIVLDIDEHGYAKTGFSPDVPLSRCVRIGRAAYYPDGTKVED